MSWHWLVCGLLRARALAAALVQPRHVAAHREHARRAHHARRLRRGQRHADDLDAEVRQVGVGELGVGRAPRQLGGRARRARAAHVDVHVGRVARARDERVRVRAAARLHRGHLPGLGHVGDVEHAHAAEPLGAHRRAHPLRPAVHPPARLLDRHEEQVAAHAHVALAAGAGERRADHRVARVRHVPHLDAVVAALEDERAAEGQVGVDEAEVARVGRVDEPLGARAVGDERHPLRGLAGVCEAGAQADARVGRGGGAGLGAGGGGGEECRGGGEGGGAERHGRGGGESGRLTPRAAARAHRARCRARAAPAEGVAPAPEPLAPAATGGAPRTGTDRAPPPP